MISIIIPVYNSEKYIQRCLNSIVNQTYHDYEVIIVDDGSTDDSRSIIIEYVNSNNNIYYYYQKNSGASVARNYAIRKARGKYLLFVDSDDYLSTDGLQIMIKKSVVFNADLVVADIMQSAISLNKSSEEYRHIFDENRCYDSKCVLSRILHLKMRGYIAGKLFLRDKWNYLQLFFEKGRLCEDWFPVTKYILNSQAIVFINKEIYFYQQHAASSIHQSNLKVISDYNYSVKKILKYVEPSHVMDDAVFVFKVLTFLETIHQLLLIVNNKKIYTVFKEYDFNYWHFDLLKIFFRRELSLKNKCSIFLWKMRLYHLFGKIRNIKWKCINKIQKQ